MSRTEQQMVDHLDKDWKLTCHAEFSPWYMEIYLHFLSFLNTDMVQVMS